MINQYSEHNGIINNDKAKELLEEKGVKVEDFTGFDAISAGLHLGYLMLVESHTASDYSHGPFETYMLQVNGILVEQEGPFGPYTVYHVVEIGYTYGNE